jgi:hypothetical protein
MAASWAVIWDSVCDFLHGKSQALSEGSAVKPAIRGSPTYFSIIYGTNSSRALIQNRVFPQPVKARTPSNQIVFPQPG